MAYTLGDLIWNIKSNTSDFDKGAKETDKQVETTSKKMKTFGSLMKGAAVAGAIVTVTKKLYDLAVQSSEMSDNVDKMSQKIGISRESYQEWDFILSQSGASVDGLQTSIKTLSNAAAEASQGTAEYSDEFDRLGISVTDANGKLKDQETLFGEVFNALSDMEDETQRTATAAKLLGRSATELAPALNAGSDSIEALKDRAHELGLVVGDDVIDAGVAFKDNLDELKRTMDTFKQKALSPIIIGFNDWYNSITKVDEAVQNLDKTLNKDKVNEIEKAFHKAWQETYNFDAAIAKITESFGVSEEALAQIIITEGTFSKTITAQAQNLVDVINFWKQYKTVVDEAKVEVEELDMAVVNNNDELVAEKVGLQNNARARDIAISKLDVMGERYKAMGDAFLKQKAIEESVIASLQEDQSVTLYTYDEMQAMWDSSTERLKKLQDQAQDTAKTVSGYLAPSLEALGTALVVGGDAWENLGKVALGSIADVLKALGYELAARAALAFVAQDYRGGIQGTLGAAAAFVGSGIVSGIAASYDVGTLAVPRDQVAVVHKGEGIMTAEQMETAKQTGLTIAPASSGGKPVIIIMQYNGKELARGVVDDINSGNSGTIHARMIKK